MAETAEFDRLMCEVRAGSEEAIWQLAETYTPYIIRAARLSLNPGFRAKLDSQDLAQTLWTSILLNRADLSRIKTPSELVAYLMRAARNKAIDKMRHYRTQRRDIRRETPLQDCAPKAAASGRRSSPELKASDPTPSDVVMVREKWNHIVAAASDRDRQIYELCCKGVEFEAISVQLRIDESTARRVIRRLVAQLSE